MRISVMLPSRLHSPPRFLSNISYLICPPFFPPAPIYTGLESVFFYISVCLLSCCRTERFVLEIEVAIVTPIIPQHNFPIASLVDFPPEVPSIIIISQLRQISIQNICLDSVNVRSD